MSDILLSQEHAGRIRHLTNEVERLRAVLRSAEDALLGNAGSDNTRIAKALLIIQGSPADCIYETRDASGSPRTAFGVGWSWRLWCRTHGFDCPNLETTATIVEKK